LVRTMKNVRNSRDVAQISLLAALMAAGAFIKIPVPFSDVPITLQFFFCALGGVILGANKAMTAELLYVAMGLMGLPVFTKGGGIGYIAQPTFGYLIGFIFAAFTIGKLFEKQNSDLTKISFINIYLSMLAGILVIYSCGLPYLYYYSIFSNSPKAFTYVFYYGFLITLPGDLIVAFFAATIARRVVPVLSRLSLK